eukprot:6195281-Pleurochrysis_carterae.AAC.4
MKEVCSQYGVTDPASLGATVTALVCMLQSFTMAACHQPHHRVHAPQRQLSDGTPINGGNNQADMLRYVYKQRLLGA